jgi:hypothetical protein
VAGEFAVRVLGALEPEVAHQNVSSVDGVGATAAIVCRGRGRRRGAAAWVCSGQLGLGLRARMM